MAFKMRGRVGDSPQAGCGLFVERGVGAAVSTGVGEEVIRIAGTARVIASMRGGMAPQAACREACEHIARRRGDAIRGLQVVRSEERRVGQEGVRTCRSRWSVDKLKKTNRNKRDETYEYKSVT